MASVFFASGEDCGVLGCAYRKQAHAHPLRQPLISVEPVEPICPKCRGHGIQASNPEALCPECSPPAACGFALEIGRSIASMDDRTEAALVSLEANSELVRQLEGAVLVLAVRAKRADALLGSDATGRSLAAALEYAAAHLEGGDLDPFAALLRAKAAEVRALAEAPGGPAPQEPADVSSLPDGLTPAGGEVYRLASDAPKPPA